MQWNFWLNISGFLSMWYSAYFILGNCSFLQVTLITALVIFHHCVSSTAEVMQLWQLMFSKFSGFIGDSLQITWLYSSVPISNWTRLSGELLKIEASGKVAARSEICGSLPLLNNTSLVELSSQSGLEIWHL